MRWTKKGLLFVNENKRDGSESHAIAPCILPMGSNNLRIYFTTRDGKGRSRVSWIEVKTGNDLWEIVREASSPVLEPGSVGCFDDSGAMTSWIVESDRGILLYYTGWNLGVTVPFRFSIGLATSTDSGLTFQKLSSGPLLDRNLVDTQMVASPCVLAGVDHFQMWYVSGVKWEREIEGPKHYYHIRYASSKDGIKWLREGRVCIDFANEMEYAIARPSVLMDRELYRMWYCYRASTQGHTYRLGYAESDDGISWIRKDASVGIDPSGEGWDSEMICYPYVFRHRGRIYMLYNGNDYGKTGFGYAVLDE